MGWSKTFLLTIFVTEVYFSSSQYALSPKNTAGLSSEAITLYVSPSTEPATISWRFREYGTTNDMPVIIGGSASPGYNISGYNLEILSLGTNRTGTYYAELFGGTTRNSYAEVLMFVAQPSCSHNSSNGMVEGDTLRLFCRVDFIGRWPAQMTWTENGVELPSTNLSVINSVSFEALVWMDRTKHRLPYKCRTFFPPPPAWVYPPDVNTSSNYQVYSRTAPTREFNFDVPLFDVNYPVERISLNVGNNSRLEPGSEIVCNADGRPAPSFQWIRLSNSTGGPSSLNGSRLSITASMEGTHVYRCVASNQPRSVATITTEISFEVYNNNAGLTNEAKIGIGVGIAAAVIILLIIIVAFCLCRGQKGKKGEKIDYPEKTPRKNEFAERNKAHPDVITMPPDSRYPDAGYGSYLRNMVAAPETPQKNGGMDIYADMALDDTPRSRKPIQVFDAPMYPDYHGGAV